MEIHGISSSIEDDDHRHWNFVAADLSPGDKRPDLIVSVCGRDAVYACELSPSFGLFTISCSVTGVTSAPYQALDVVLKKNDGWSSDDISVVVKVLKERMAKDRDQPSVSNIVITGFLERMRAKSLSDTSPLCLHATSITLEYMERTKPAMTWKPQEQPNILTSNPTTSAAITTQETFGKSVKGWRGAKDDSRFSKFATFLLETFGGYEALSEHPVLDIAGGAGGLSFELSVRHSLPCIVVDTQPLRFNGKQRRHVQFRQACVEKLRDHNGKSPLALNLLRRFQVANDLETLQLTQIRTLVQASQMLDQHQVEGFDTSQQKLRSILYNKECSVLCGLHPDQATDEIIDIGLAMHIPWAVVPCCVFPNLFRSRMVEGRAARSYEDYCAYIRSRRNDIREVELPFRGRNKVFFWIPPVESVVGRSPPIF